MCVPKRMKVMTKAISERDFKTFAETTMKVAIIFYFVACTPIFYLVFYPLIMYLVPSVFIHLILALKRAWQPKKGTSTRF